MKNFILTLTAVILHLLAPVPTIIAQVQGPFLGLDEMIALPACGGSAQVQSTEYGPKFILRGVKNCQYTSSSGGTAKLALDPDHSYKFDFLLEPTAQTLDILVHSENQNIKDFFVIRLPEYKFRDSKKNHWKHKDKNFKSEHPSFSYSHKKDLHEEIQHPYLALTKSDARYQSCDDTFDGPSNLDRCLNLVASRRLKVELIRACDSSFDGDTNELECLSSARDLNQIHSCDTTFDGDEAELKCLRAETSVVEIRACEEVFDGDTAEQACMDTIAKRFVGVENLVRACEASFDGDANELECLVHAIKYGPDSIRIVKRCEQEKNGDDEELRCLK